MWRVGLRRIGLRRIGREGNRLGQFFGHGDFRESGLRFADKTAHGYRRAFDRTWAKPLMNKGNFVMWVKEGLTLQGRGIFCSGLWRRRHSEPAREGRVSMLGGLGGPGNLPLQPPISIDISPKGIYGITTLAAAW